MTRFREHLNKLVTHKFMGPDGMNPQMLSKMLDIITKALLIIFGRLWQLGDVPKDGRKQMSPLSFFKKGRKARRKIQGMTGKSTLL